MITTLRMSALGLLTILGFSSGTAQAQYVPGFGYGRPIITGGTTITPFSISQRQYSVSPWLRQVVDNQTYLNTYTGVAYQRQFFSNPYGTWSTTRAYNPWFGPTTDFRFSNVGPIDSYQFYGPYRPGFAINRW